MKSPKDRERVSEDYGRDTGVARSQIRMSTKAATHPVRSRILKALKEAPRSTAELEEITNEARYNLYHHLNFLENAGLVVGKLKDHKTKIYSLLNPKQPNAAVVIFDREDIQTKYADFMNLVKAISQMEGQDLPHPDKISRAEICIYYEYEK
jgi:DNA-binding transcriptional ArsR family regulator